MPDDVRLILGFVGPHAIARAGQEMGLTFLDEDGQAVAYDPHAVADVDIREDPRLIQAQIAAFAAMGVPTHATRHHRLDVQVRGQNCTASAFTLDHFFDDAEVGDKPHDAVLGIALDGRYHPVFLDALARPRSLSTRAISAHMPAVDAVRDALAAYWPVFKDAQLVVKSVFY